MPAGLAGSAFVLVVLPFLDERQGELFGAPPPVGVPWDDVFGWYRGLVPVALRKAVRREIQRRGLRQEDAAAVLCVSRPQLANLLQGRFGASPRVAERIRKFILENAKTVRADWGQ